MGRVISIMQNKGGVGKSTITSNLAAALSRRYPVKVLIVDMDPQGNQAISFGYKPSRIINTIYDVLVKQMPPENTLIALDNNLHLLPSNGDMNFYEIDTLFLIEKIGFQNYLLSLQKALTSLTKKFDYIFIDSPPELKIIALQILLITNDIYIPFESDAYNAEGLMALLEKIEENKRQYNASPTIQGLILNKVRERTTLHKGVSVQVDAYCQKKGIRILKTHIPFSTMYPKSVATTGAPITWSDPNSKHASYYYDLLEEVLSHG